MKTNDYVKYVTQQVVKYIDQPKEERHQLRERRKLEREPFLYRWFGLIPMSIMLMWKRNNK